MAPEILTYAETGTFVLAAGMIIYNRFVSWRGYEKRTSKLEDAMEKVQKLPERTQELEKLVLALGTKFDGFSLQIMNYVKSCDVCRGEIRHHHEDAEVHVSPARTAMLADIQARLIRIEDRLMNGKEK